MRPAVPAFILAVLAISVLFIIPATMSDSALSDTDVGLVPYDTHIDVNAGSSGSFTIEVVNHLPQLQASTDNITDNTRMISIKFISPPDTDVSVDDKDNNFTLDGQGHCTVTVDVNVHKYATAGTYQIGVVLNVTLLDGTSTLTTAPVQVELTVLSPLSSGDTYNKIMGLFKNPFPEPFDGPLASAVITFLLWMVIGSLILFALIPVLLRAFMRNHTEEGKKVKKGLRALVPLVVLLFAFDSSLRVYGASESIIGPVEVWFNVFYIILGAVIAWGIYLIFIQYIISRISDNRHIEKKEMDLEPLLRLFGKLIIWVFAVAMIMAAWGFNLTAIVTSAGIISLGITLGAQNILNQFFSGMVLLLSRPFKSGDLVKVGSSNTVYRVSRVNIMNTVFENWDNEETVIMPNNAVSSSTIVNITGEGLIYKTLIFMNVAYDSDIALAKKLMEKAAMDHPNIITNGSVDLPSTRVTAFLDSSIEIRLIGYVYDFNDNGRVGGELREAIFRAFKENGIKIPFPQRDINLNVVSKEGPQEAEKD